MVSNPTLTAAGQWACSLSKPFPAQQHQNNELFCFVLCIMVIWCDVPANLLGTLSIGWTLQQEVASVALIHFLVAFSKCQTALLMVAWCFRCLDKIHLNWTPKSIGSRLSDLFFCVTSTRLATSLSKSKEPIFMYKWDNFQWYLQIFPSNWPDFSRGST